LTRAVVALAMAYNFFMLVIHVGDKLFTLGLVLYLASLGGLVVSAVYAFKRLYQFMTGDRDRQHSAGDQLIRALLIGGLIQLVGVAMRYEPPQAAEAPVRKAAVFHQAPTDVTQGEQALHC